MLSLLLISVCVFIFITLFGYFGHKALHQPWAKGFNKSHMVHHLVLYPPENLTSDKYLSAGRNSTTWIFLILSSPLLLIPIALWLFGIVSLSTAACINLEMLFFGWLHDYIHDSFHVNNHFFTKIPLFNKIFDAWKKLHFVHHSDMQKNLGIFVFFWDKRFKTYTSKL